MCYYSRVRLSLLCVFLLSLFLFYYYYYFFFPFSHSVWCVYFPFPAFCLFLSKIKSYHRFFFRDGGVRVEQHSLPPRKRVYICVCVCVSNSCSSRAELEREIEREEKRKRVTESLWNFSLAIRREREIMEGKKQVGSSSSFTTELFGSKEPSPSSGIFSSIFAPSPNPKVYIDTSISVCVCVCIHFLL